MHHLPSVAYFGAQCLDLYICICAIAVGLVSSCAQFMVKLHLTKKRFVCINKGTRHVFENPRVLHLAALQRIKPREWCQLIHPVERRTEGNIRMW